MAMLKIQSVIAEKNYQSKMILQIHDELVFEVPPRESSKLIADIREKYGKCLSFNCSFNS